jgi:hypothetical protein
MNRLVLLFLFICLLLGAFALSQFVLPNVLRVDYTQGGEQAVVTASTKKIETEVPLPPVDTREVVEHVPLPSAQKVIYMTSCIVGTPSLRDGLVKFVEESEANALIIDIKDFSGTLSYEPSSPEWKDAWDNARCGARDMKAFVASLHEKGIYVIGRITVFQDPFYTLRHPEDAVKKASDGTNWKDFKGLSFIDVSAKPYHDHLMALAIDAYNTGFDELNFDYIRYPSDGPMSDISFQNMGKNTKPENLETFFKYLHEHLSDPKAFDAVKHEHTGRATSTPYLSADLFGMTTTNTDDLSIGQVLERALPYFDFIDPMVYPSHYPKSFLGLDDPNKHVYRVVNHSMGEAVRRAVSTTTPVAGFLHTRIGTSTPALYTKPVYDIQKLRPWLQDFDYGGNYDIPEVQAQIKATYDTGLKSWMIWDPGNHYTRGAYLSE